VVLEITQHDLPEPCTDFGHAIMRPALKLSLDGFELRDHSLLRGDPPYGEGSALVTLPTVVGKAQEVEGLWFSLSTQLPVASVEPGEEQVWEALRALYLIGQLEDLPAIRPYQRELPEVPERLRQQAIETERAIQERARATK